MSIKIDCPDYTKAELKKVVKEEREIINDLTLKAMIEIQCESYDNAMGFLKAIRARGNE